MQKRWLQLFLCAISGGAMGGCLLLTQLGPGVFFLAVPAMVVFRKQTNKKQLLSCCCFFAMGLCMVSYFPAFSIRPTIPQAYIFWIDLAVYVVLIAVHGSVLMVALWLGYRLPTLKGCRVLSIALFWAGAEWLLGFGPFAWPTARLSLALWQYPTLFRSASLGGQLLVSGLIIAVNGLISQAIFYRENKKSWLWGFMAVGLFTGNVLFGVIYDQAPTATVPVAIIQPGGTAIGSERGTVYNDAFSLTQQAVMSKPQLILLPEGILPSYVNDDVTVQKQWGELAKQANGDLLVGGSKEGSSTVVQYGPNGTQINCYQKIREVPFFENGEGKPFRFFPENHPSVLITKSGKVGTLICYESMFSSLAQRSVSQGAQLLFTSTNDSWFDSSQAKTLHVAHGAYRAVETGRTLVQAAINGMTAVFDASGNITYNAPEKTKVIVNATVTFDTVDTLYNRIGDWWLAMGIFAVMTAAMYLQMKKRRVNRD